MSSATKITTFDTIDKALMKPIEATMDHGVAGLSAALSAPVTACATIYIAFIGYNVIYGHSSMPLRDFISTTVKLAIIVMLTTKAGEYNVWVKNIFFVDLPNAITGVMKSSTPDSNTWDTMINNATSDIVEQTTEASMPWAIGTWIGGTLCILIASIFCVIGFIVATFAQIGLSLILSLGPLFISLSMFSTTRRFTEAWIGQVAHFVILQILVILLGGIYVDIAMALFKGGLKEVATTLMQFTIIGICGAFLFLNLPAIASALADGGASLSSGGLSQKIGNTAQRGAAKAVSKGLNFVKLLRG
ncbi:type IV secretion protein VblB6 [Bartonella australis AUST/NH1]|uniref:Type IV secretion protein VblB6 n=1 Tax=Bartonella australis (strain Aust/NH1) TaxID=1094489 RepID=M1PE85_BARAA|nr:type IV secretion system protein [Bartonella australis]AGF74931.1 type IV secretion protein VblB6 [Bartonella australis AUST/NH1]